QGVRCRRAGPVRTSAAAVRPSRGAQGQALRLPQMREVPSQRRVQHEVSKLPWYPPVRRPEGDAGLAPIATWHQSRPDHPVRSRQILTTAGLLARESTLHPPSRLSWPASGLPDASSSLTVAGAAAASTPALGPSFRVCLLFRI